MNEGVVRNKTLDVVFVAQNDSVNAFKWSDPMVSASLAEVATIKRWGFSIIVALLVSGFPMAASARFAATDAWRSFNFSNEQYIFVRGTINGHATDMLLDTGSQISVIDEAFAKGAGVRRGKKLKLRGIGGRAKTYSARNVKVSVGDLPLDRMDIALADLSAFSLAIIESSDPGWYLIDTGNASTVTVLAAFARDQRILEDRVLISESVSSGIGGIVRETTTSVGSFAIGGFELKDMPIDVPIASEGRQTSEDFDGLLGNEVLSRFRVILDFSRSQIHLEPGSDWDTRELSNGAFGTSIMMLDENGVDRTVILARYY